MELVGKVVLVPRDREGWGDASVDVPCVVRRFVKGATRTKKTKSKQSYYEVDSLYLKAHYPLLARRHGWSWRWSAREVESFVCRELETADEPDRRVHARSNKKKKEYVAPALSSKLPEVQVDKVIHPLALAGCAPSSWASAAAQEEGRLAHVKLNSQLYAPATSLLYQFIHKQLINDVSEMGKGILAKLLPAAPRGKKVDVDPEYDPSLGKVCMTFNTDVAKVLRALLLCGGFIADDDGRVFTAGNGDSVTAMFGAGCVNGGFNPLMKMTFFSARKISKLKPSALHNPLTATDEEIYAAAEDELGTAACDDDGMLPAWRLRELIVLKMQGSNDVLPDWRVAGVASVDVERAVTVAFKAATGKVNKKAVCEKESVTIRFTWQGRSRMRPGNTLMKIRFVSLLRGD